MDFNELFGKITQKAMEEEAFKQKLLADPKAVVAEIGGFGIPASVKVTIHESTAENLVFVLPQDPGRKTAELSDAELDQVAGGVSDGKQQNPYADPGILVGPGGIRPEFNPETILITPAPSANPWINPQN